MTEKPIVTLLTDFGDADTWVGQMKGAALSVEPSLRIVDLSHEVPAHDVAAGAYLLEIGYSAFPPGTIHVAVVDPGVGTARRALAVFCERHVFVAPDNGLLGRVLEREPPLEVRVIDEPRFRRASAATTFDGRDLFAPAAAWIARGTPPHELGPEAGSIVRLPRSGRRPEPDHPSAVRVVHVDRFGNVVLDLRLDEPGAGSRTRRSGRPALRVSTARESIGDRFESFAEGSATEPFLIVNSAGYLEIALDRGRADRHLGLRVGDEVEVAIGS